MVKILFYAAKNEEIKAKFHVRGHFHVQNIWINILSALELYFDGGFALILAKILENHIFAKNC
jgi:hypothetical protein